MLWRWPRHVAKVLRREGDRLRLEQWSVEEGAGQITVLTHGKAVADATAAWAVEVAAGRGYRRLRTSALYSFETEPFLRTGFKPCEQLVMLTRPLGAALPDLAQKPSLRRGRHRDRGPVLEVDAASFAPYWQLGRTGLRNTLRATPQRRFRVATSTAPTGKEIIGYAICGLDGAAGYIQRLAVVPGQQSSGIGACLVRDGLEWMTRKGVVTVWVNTSKDNLNAIRFYERLGFQLELSNLQILERNITS